MIDIEKLLNCNTYDKPVVKYNVDSGRVGTFKSGGTLSCVVYPRSDKDIVATYNSITPESDVALLGRGSNTLFADEGYTGIVLCTILSSNMTIEDCTVHCSSGLGLFKLNRLLMRLGLSGLEWSYGIPGTIGGAVAINAGAFGGQMADVVEYVDVLVGGSSIRMKTAELNFAYRSSAIQNDMICLAVGLRLTISTSGAVNAAMQDYSARRNATQPHEPSLGSAFKRLGDKSIAQRLTQLQLGGKRVGDAEISTKHNGFIVNKGLARTSDYLLLASYMQSEVYKHFQEEYLLEVKYIGAYDDTFWRLSHSHHQQRRA